MNPFRDRQPEQMAENVLSRLKEGNVEVLTSFVQSDSPFPKSEKKYRINAWRIAGSNVRDGKLWISYWVTRDNYPRNEEDVNFSFVRNGDDWQLETFNAIY